MDYAAARRNMVENQIRTNRVTDPLIIDAMAELPRELFVPEHLRGIAYVDEDVPIGGGRYMTEPLATALLLQAAEIGPEDVVLDVGCGLGYTAAIIARMASTVVALESDPTLAAEATQVLHDLEMDTVAVVEAPIPAGYPKQAPYDVIVFEGAVSSIPAPFRDQLAEGGRMVAVIGSGGRGKGTRFLRAGGVISQEEVFDAAVPVLPGFEATPTFTF